MLTEDEEFIGVITSTIFDLERLKEMLFVPIEINYTNVINPLEYIDVDQNYYSECTQLINAECKYQNEDSFNDYMHDNSLSMLHLNMRSMNKNTNEFKRYKH